jgi:hypothetical protein
MLCNERDEIVVDNVNAIIKIFKGILSFVFGKTKHSATLICYQRPQSLLKRSWVAKTKSLYKEKREQCILVVGGSL